MRLCAQSKAHCSSRNGTHKQLIPRTRAAFARMHSTNGTGTTAILEAVPTLARPTPTGISDNNPPLVETPLQVSASTDGTFTTWSVALKTHVPASIDDKKLDNLGLDLKVTSLDGSDVILPPLQVSKTVSYVRKNESLQGRIDYFSIVLPVKFQPAAVSLNDRADAGDTLFQKGGKYERLFVERIILTPYNNRKDKLSFTANSYISVIQDWRLFVRDDAWTDKKLRNNPTIIKLQQTELAELRGEGSNVVIASQVPRQPGDRIYRFAPYNDLGKNPVIPDDIRPTLGGKDFPYPRRLDTNRALWPDSCFETPPDDSGITEQWVPAQELKVLGAILDKALASPWVPEDDNFDSDKDTGFLGNAVLGALPSVLTQLDNALAGRPLTQGLRDIIEKYGLSAGEEFDSIREVEKLYQNGDQLNGSKTKLNGDKDLAGELKKNFTGLLENLGGFSSIKNTFNEKTGSTPPSPGPGSDGCIDLLKYNIPRSLYFAGVEGYEEFNRFDTWHSDKEFGRMFLAGLNPLVIEAVNSPEDLNRLLKGTNIKDTDIKGLLEEHTFAELAQSATPRLFVVDYTALYDSLPEIDQAADGEPVGVQHAGRAVFFRNKNGFMVPVAIELAYHNPGAADKPYTVYTPNDGDNIWLLAKVLFMSIDSGVHQLLSHFVRTHASVEPYLISTRRQLAPTHPIFRLLMPHFRYTLPINAAARSLLINAGGVIETNFTPGPYSMALSSKLYGMTWQFKNEGLVADLKKRGLLPASGTSAADLTLKDYPYAQDGFDIWAAMHDYFTEYVNYYYGDDSEVPADDMLNAWYLDIQTQGHPDAPQSGWIELNSRASLVDICCTMAWVASAHHAAVNFGQYDYTGWMVTHASLCRKPAPARGSKEWKDLEKATGDAAQKLMLTWLSPPVNATKVLTTVKLLSAHATDEHYLSSNEQDWLPLEDDANVRDIFNRFVKRMEVVESNIQARNRDPQYITRDPKKDGLPYTLLMPGSEAGVTMRGVPYSISI